MKYGHSEVRYKLSFIYMFFFILKSCYFLKKLSFFFFLISDFYTIVDNDGQVLNTLPLSAIQAPLLMESFNIPVLASSLSLQR